MIGRTPGPTQFRLLVQPLMACIFAIWADALAQMDSYTGEWLDLVDKLGIRDHTIFIFTADNGPEILESWSGWSGPWRERTSPAWTVPACALHHPLARQDSCRREQRNRARDDLFTTVAAMVGGKALSDRAMDGVDQSQFFLGKQEKFLTF